MKMKLNHLYYFPTKTPTDIKYIYVWKHISRKLKIYNMKIGFDKAFKLVPTLPRSVDKINISTTFFLLLLDDIFNILLSVITENE